MIPLHFSWLLSLSRTHTHNFIQTFYPPHQSSHTPQCLLHPQTFCSSSLLCTVVAASNLRDKHTHSTLGHGAPISLIFPFICLLGLPFLYATHFVSFHISQHVGCTKPSCLKKKKKLFLSICCLKSPWVPVKSAHWSARCYSAGLSTEHKYAQNIHNWTQPLSTPLIIFWWKSSTTKILFFIALAFMFPCNGNIFNTDGLLKSVNDGKTTINHIFFVRVVRWVLGSVPRPYVAPLPPHEQWGLQDHLYRWKNNNLHKIPSLLSPTPDPALAITISSMSDTGVAISLK